MLCHVWGNPSVYREISIPTKSINDKSASGHTNWFGLNVLEYGDNLKWRKDNDCPIHPGCTMTPTLVLRQPIKGATRKTLVVCQSYMIWQRPALPQKKTIHVLIWLSRSRRQNCDTLGVGFITALIKTLIDITGHSGDHENYSCKWQDQVLDIEDHDVP